MAVFFIIGIASYFFFFVLFFFFVVVVVRIVPPVILRAICCANVFAKYVAAVPMMLPMKLFFMLDERFVALACSFSCFSRSRSACSYASASAASAAACSRCFEIFSNADSRSTASSYLPAMRDDAMSSARCSSVMAPIWLIGKRIFAR